ncbi:CvpA family protein [Tundrisphaera lichenicola]|uniref:CvpA family protein n=1 Tax=Tundrisphaera lichenicola TaxID=2029860 RepID=UPI003EB95389
MTLTVYDAAMAGVVVAGMIWGAWRGVTWQLASIASLILGYIASHQLAPQLAPRFGTDPVISRTLSMMAVYAVVSGGVFLVAWIFRAILRKMKFEAFDRHLGMLLGGMEGAILGMIVTFFVISLAPQTRDPIYASPSGKLVASVINTLGPMVKSEANEAFAPFIEESKQTVGSGEKIMMLLPAAAAAAAKVDSQVDRTSDTNARAIDRR